jgi:hypothetical protein
MVMRNSHRPVLDQAPSLLSGAEYLAPGSGLFYNSIIRVKVIADRSHLNRLADI